jgi:hypothetical protein
MEACPQQLLVLKDILNSFACVTGLKVNYNKSVILPINISEERLQSLANTFDCQTGSMPFTYLGLPLGTTKPKIEDFLPLVHKVERRLISTSIFLSQAGRLEMVNSVLSSSVVYHCCTLKLHKGVIEQLDKYRKHCLWRGSDLNAKQAPKAAWSVVCLPKKEGGLGVLNLSIHNDSLLMKFLHKFYSKADIPWVHLVWDNYYANGRLPGQQIKGSFWWKDVVKLIPQFKNMASAVVRDGSSVLLWQDKWNGHTLQQDFPELFSFAKKTDVTVKAILHNNQLECNFHLPLSLEAHQQFLIFESLIADIEHSAEHDSWAYSWGNALFSATKVYKLLVGHRQVHPVFNWLWRSRCQLKHKVFFWLFLIDRLSTRDILQRKNMVLESYTCDMCILQRLETAAHLFLRCNFAKACWASIGISVATSRPVPQILIRIKRNLGVPFFMEIIILMVWSIWKTRNDWIFNNIDPSVEVCRIRFISEFKLLLHRVKQSSVPQLENWLNALGT